LISTEHILLSIHLNFVKCKDKIIIRQGVEIYNRIEIILLNVQLSSIKDIEQKT